MLRLALGFKARALDALEADGFSQYHYSLLAVVGDQAHKAHKAHKAQATIASALGLDPSQLVGVLDALEQKALIARQRDPNDRRRQLVSLTAKGRQQLARLRTKIDRLEDELFAPLDAKTRKDLHDVLLRLAAYHEPNCFPGPCP